MTEDDFIVPFEKRNIHLILTLMYMDILPMILPIPLPKPLPLLHEHYQLLNQYQLKQ